MARRPSLWENHPFPILLYVEWILLGIALLTVISTSFRPHRSSLRPPPPIDQLPPTEVYPRPNLRQPPANAPNLRGVRERRARRSRRFPLGALLGIGLLGILGLRLPSQGSRLDQIGHTGLGLGLSWLTILMGGRGASIFPALLLIVVIRSCLLFPWSGRLFVAFGAYSSFILMMVMGFLDIRPLGIPVGRPLPRLLQNFPPEEIRSVIVGLTLNSALLFGLVLAFVLMLIGALLAEKDSRQKLMSANRRLRDYALLIEDQATLQERNRIAREIHDSLGHALTAQSIQLENVSMFLSGNTLKQAQTHLQQARQLGKEALQGVRQSVSTLRTQPWQGKSLTTALSELTQEFSQNTQIQVTTQLDLRHEVSPEISNALYRLVQEGLTNIAKHSQANQAELSLQQTATHIRLHLKDNGQGFNPESNSTGFGLHSMRERVEALGGQFYLTSQPQKGCQIQAVLTMMQAIS